MNGPTLPDRPALNRRCRLQWEPAQGAHVLLYPEGMVRLNDSAAAILQGCDGASSVAQIVGRLEAQFGATGLRAEVESFMAHAFLHDWIV
ncbi:pyrroloquinoline quinone biosynthesis protein D [Pseudoduganella lurida]|uniref:Pyrroloquinoline quinone biosynthesis protein D n=1 Tax=Pseudoduganella lurida TaxID=1036180 RepID=A0A562RJ92_9BURK|nr:pyrroloquinoline quinone biosynthesis peptide chaperone PqqD [Pseudoduganella lurida]TWI69135.1 pyrroloquinoline quinone biosynthesis protein D [Pseudoduganella lurida]